MKKILSFLLVVVMLFSTTAIYAQAAGELFSSANITISDSSSESKIIISSDSAASGLCLYVAAYKNNVLQDIVKQDNISLTAGNNEFPVTPTWTTSQRDKVRVFLWDQNLSPVTQRKNLYLYTRIKGAIVNYADAEDPDNFYGLYAHNAEPLQIVADPLVNGNKVYFLNSDKSDEAKHTYLKIDTQFEPGCTYTVEYEVLLGDDVNGNKIQSANIGTCFAYANNGSNSISQTLAASTAVNAGEWRKVSQTYTVPADFNTSFQDQFFGIFANPVNSTSVDFYIDNLKVVPAGGVPEDGTETPGDDDDTPEDDPSDTGIKGAIIDNADAEEGTADETEEIYNLYATSSDLSIVKDPVMDGNNVYFLESNKSKGSWTYLKIDTQFEAGCTYLVKYDVLLGDDVNGNAVQSTTIGTNFRYAQNGSTSQTDHALLTHNVKAGEWTTVSQEYTVPADYNTNVGCMFGIYGTPVNSIGIDIYLDNILVAPKANVPSDDLNIGNAKDIYFVGTTLQGNAEKNPLEYTAGETMTFKLCIKSKTASGNLTVPYIQYTCEGDDGVKTQGYVAPSDDGYYYFDTKCDRDGFVRVIAKICNKNKRVLRDYAIFEGGAGADIDEITCDTPHPDADDYSEFWDELKKTAFALENKVIYEIISKKDGFVIKDMRLKTAEGAGDYASFIITYPENATPGTLKLRMIFMGYGVASATASTASDRGGYISVSMNTHDIPNGLTTAEYNTLKSQKYQGYGWDDVENQNPETSYWWKVFIRNMQVYNYATSLDLFDGKNVEFTGGSQGGFQACNMAAHIDSATYLSIDIPWFGNLYGNSVSSRQQGWYPNPADGLCYFDTAIAAKHVTCETKITAGLGDYTCPPSAIMAIYNNLTCKKSLTFMQNRTHTYTAPSYSRYTISAESK